MLTGVCRRDNGVLFLCYGPEMDVFRNEPWQSIDAPELHNIEAYTFLEERQLCAWLAQEIYTGKGEIVDAGAFFGGSALSFAVGLARNQRLADDDKVGRVHSFDKFEWDPWIKQEFRPENVAFGSSFANRYHDTVKPYDAMVTVYPGDICQRRWRSGPIEILFIDCAKTFAANAAVMRLFFPHLSPESIIIQQDYAVLSRLIWIHAAMEYLWDFFDDHGCTKFGGSTLFSVKKAIAAEDVEDCIQAIRTNCLALAQSAAERFSDRRRAGILNSIAAYKDSPLPLTITDC